jgi:hypothetical protein
MIRSMACGCPTFVKSFADMDGLGLRNGVNCITWDSIDELTTLVRHWLEPARRTELREIGRLGAELMQAKHTWTYRMSELAALIATVRGHTT